MIGKHSHKFFCFAYTTYERRIIIKREKVIKFIFYVFLPLTLGGIVSLFFDTNSYSLLNLPSLSPPPIIFPIVWSILYLLMGISYYIISYDNLNLLVSKLYYLQLLLNIIWPILFFNYNLYLLASLDILLMIIILVNLILKMSTINKTSGLLNIPYLLWLLFAFYLSTGVYLLN